MKLLNVLLLFSLFSCVRIPSGDITLIECQLIASTDGSPIANKQVYIVENAINFFSPSADQFTPPVDSVKTDEQGNFEYAFFHDDCCLYYLLPPNDFCFELLNVPVVTRFRQIIRAEPILPLLNVNFKSELDSLIGINIRVSSASPCSGRPGGGFSDRAIPIGYDTTFVLKVTPFSTNTISLRKINHDETFTDEQIEVTVEDTPVQVFLE